MSSKSHAFTIKFEGRVRAPISTVVITTSENDHAVKCNAIWDTGATGTCISEKVIKALGLELYKYTDIHSVSGPGRAGQYIVDIVLPNNVRVSNVKACEFSPANGIDVLIGMNIITLGDFSITNADGKTWMSFRYPSDYRHIDYEKAQSKDRNGKLAKEHINRNQE